jgi:hypothetical protein
VDRTGNGPTPTIQPRAKTYKRESAQLMCLTLLVITFRRH